MDIFRAHTEEIGHQIASLGVGLGIDWEDEAAVRALAREAIDHARATVDSAGVRKEGQALLKAELFGLAALMLKNMEESAERGFLTHGGPSWKAFARALWLEYERSAQARDKS